MLEARGLTKYYSAIPAVRDVSFRIAGGGVLGILGPNGPATLIKDPGEQGCCSDIAKLAYGNSWSKGPFTCQSSTKGLTCTGSNGHGFFVSKAKVTVK